MFSEVFLCLRNKSYDFVKSSYIFSRIFFLKTCYKIITRIKQKNYVLKFSKILSPNFMPRNFEIEKLH